LFLASPRLFFKNSTGIKTGEQKVHVDNFLLLLYKQPTKTSMSVFPRLPRSVYVSTFSGVSQQREFKGTTKSFFTKPMSKTFCKTIHKNFNASFSSVGFILSRSGVFLGSRRGKFEVAHTKKTEAKYLALSCLSIPHFLGPSPLLRSPYPARARSRSGITPPPARPRILKSPPLYKQYV
jgi:hypothetical protein